MIEKFQGPEFLDLLKQRESPSLTLTMPVLQSRMELKKNNIILKNLIKQARHDLEVRGEASRLINDLLRPLEKRIDDYGFWRQMDSGLAMLRSPSVYREFSLPLEVRKSVFAGPRFQVIPLIPVFSPPETCYVLTLHRKGARLYRGSRFDFNEQSTGGFPVPGVIPLEDQDPQKHLQFHTGTPSTQGRRRAVFHGHGGGDDEPREEEILLRFLRNTDDRVKTVLKDPGIPLVLAGSGDLVALFRRISEVPQLVDNHLSLDPEEMKPEDVRKQARQLLAPHFDLRKIRAVETCRSLLGTGKSSIDLKETILAAHQGRVETVMIREGSQIWGVFNGSVPEVTLGASSIKHNDNLLDYAAARTLEQGGEVFLLPADEMPEKAAVAAIFRY